MKERHRPKIYMRHWIHRDNKPVGLIQLVQYYQKENGVENRPHIEFKLDSEYRGQGIMSAELPKYLKMCKKYDDFQIVALVDGGNESSFKLLERNGFVKIWEVEQVSAFITDLRLPYSLLKESATSLARYNAKKRRFKQDLWGQEDE